MHSIYLSTTLTSFESLDYTMTAYTSLPNSFLLSQISREIILNILDANVYQEFISRQNGATYVYLFSLFDSTHNS